MTLQHDSQKPHIPDPLETAQRLSKLWIRLQDVMNKSSESYKNKTPATNNFDPYNLAPAIQKFWETALDNPENFMNAQMALWQKNMDIWRNTWTAFVEGTNLAEASKHTTYDRRFKSELWHTNPYFYFLKQTYQTTAQWIMEQVQRTDDMDDETRKKLTFFTQQYIDALSPSNFPFSNPEVLKETLNTGGQNLIEGIENLIEDLENAQGTWALRTTDKSAFKVGENLAITKGAVIYQNDLIQLIQYAPTTTKVSKTPLLVIPPWINKYYILDMRPDNSFVKWLTDQGHTTFIISWVNPNKSHRKKNFASYMEEGIFAALNAIEKITKEKDCNVIGYCIGGTLLTCALGYLHAIGKQERIKSATFLTTLVDFQDSGDIKVFIDEKQVENMESMMAEKGYLEADMMKTTFSMMRANDLIWSFFVNNYLLGKDPFPFDLLFWNDDSVNLPEANHSYYLRNMYLKNNLIKPNAIKMKNVGIDITKIKTPAFFLSTREDHIAPWQATYQTTQYFKGPCRFTLAASGHIAGVVNPPSSQKYCHWTYDKTPKTPEEWMSKAKEHGGSWWPEWQKWITPYAGESVPPRKIKDEIEPAPGSYVKSS